ncbi:TPA: hypothetical protein H1005_04520 [archaeon]|nr:hypothetical protein [Candidatus Naiadarchaeales archaeon SRR2090153.bin1042]
MPTCITCSTETTEGLSCSTCGNPVHKSCSKMFNNKRYCKKDARKERKIYDLARGL